MKRGQFNAAPLKERFHAQYAVSDCGCWLWTGALASANGYGTIKDNYRSRGAHRVSYEIHKGPIPQGAMVCHTCDTRHCVNPDHLYAGTSYDNMRDKVQRGRANARKGLEHWNAKLTDADVSEIRTSPLRNVDLARQFGLAPSTVSQIRSGARRSV